MTLKRAFAGECLQVAVVCAELARFTTLELGIVAWRDETRKAPILRGLDFRSLKMRRRFFGLPSLAICLPTGFKHPAAIGMCLALVPLRNPTK